MENAVIVGTYQFIGFHLCHSLLEEGEAVYGVSYPNVEIKDIEDKRLEIGRNANYQEISWENKTAFESGKIIYDCYDLSKSKQIVERIKSDVLQYNVQELIRHNQELIFLGNILEFEEHEKNLYSLLEQQGLPYRAIYFPTLFGPWQPDEFLFAQLLEGNEEIIISEQEYREDAIFIADAVLSVKELLVKKSGKYTFLRSGLQNQWQQCQKEIRELTVDIPSYTIPPKLHTYSVASTNSNAENLEMQRRHIKMYK
ncbi:hypothetical protein CEQ21_09145 [Niallia circulans]|uniref:Uncharacterized protein n=1 Tax=Niallia circulans TaxID=1397 RepID=A0A553SFM0_NIACI|nr:hypothetical protein [Niallia circulans]TRZ35789.1 hypothetical protein CEQ21_09145 [Niallia circulans]